MVIGLGAVLLAVAAGVVVVKITSPSAPAPELVNPAPGPVVPGQRSMPDPAAGSGVPAASPACKGVRVNAGAAIQPILRSAGKGATICFGKGLHRLTRPIVPLDGQRLIAANGTVLSGTVPLGSWSKAGKTWETKANLPATPQPFGECEKAHPRCGYPEGVLLDGRPLAQANDLDQLGPGKFFLEYDRDLVHIGDGPQGHKVELALAPAAIRSSARNVTVQGFVIEGFANPAQIGAIHMPEDSRAGGWTVRGNEIRYNNGVGLTAIDSKVVANHIHHNGHIGITVSRGGGLVEGNEINGNTTKGFNTGWEAGGGKFTHTVGLVLRRNFVHDNNGPGLWSDLSAYKTTYEGNLIRNNGYDGIHHEISYDAVIKDNQIIGNGASEPQKGYGASGIRIAASRNVQIAGNVLSGNRNGIMLVQQDRPDDPSDRGPHEITNVTVTGNDVAMTSGQTGLVQDIGDDSLFTRDVVTFARNTYRLRPLNGQYFAWRDDDLTRTNWVGSGQDTNSVFLPIGQ